MSDEAAGFTDAELADFERWAHEDSHGNLGQQANARRILRLVAEVRRLQLDAARLHVHHMRQEPDRCRACVEFNAALPKPEVH